MYSETPLLLGAAVWRSEGSLGAVVPADGCVDLILRDAKITVAGPSTRWIATERDGDSGTIGLRIPPGFAGDVLRASLVDLVDRVVPLEDVTDRSALDLRDALARLGDGRGSIEHAAKLVARTTTTTATGSTATAIRRCAIRAVPAAAVAAELGVSQRTLRRRMLSRFGYGYATLVRIERAARAQRLLSGGAAVAETATATGFADQPHLTREFRRFVGASPAQFAESSA